MANPVPEPLQVDKLDLDPENPRLPEDLEVEDQLAILRFFLENYDLEEIGWSMAENGYFDEEPLLTTQSTHDADRRIVVEGNRRLATLRLLTDPDTRSAVRPPPVWEELAEFAKEHDLGVVPTRRYASREDLLEYLGFRHVSGLMPWTAEAKARYVFALITEHDYTFQKAGRAIGSRADAIRRNFVAWSVLEQCRKAGVEVQPAVRRFGVYYRSLQLPGIRRFVTLAKNGSDPWFDATEDLADPLNANNGPPRVAELIRYLWGPERVLRDSRELDDLARIVTDTGALAVLRTEKRLDVALEEIPADRDAVYANLRAAYRSARMVYGEAHNFTADSELLEEARRLSDMATRVVVALEMPPQERT